MLQALLRGKLLGSVPEPERLEDALTSTVFGTLLMVEAFDVLHEWLSGARDAEGRVASEEQLPGTCEAWFWPGLSAAEPDVVLCLESRLYVVEAKYHANRHDGPPVEMDPTKDDEEPIRDQLKRQWLSIEHIRKGVGRGPDSLVEAVSRCEVTFVFLVDQRRMGLARREYLESLGMMRGADLRLLTWQDLYRILRGQAKRRASRWAADLTEFLELTGLDSFCGISRFPREVATYCSRIGSWRSAALTREGELRRAVARVLWLGPTARGAIAEWPRRRTGSRHGRRFGWQDAMALVVSGKLTTWSARIMRFHGVEVAGREERHG